MVQLRRGVGLSQGLASFVGTLTFEDLPPEVVDRAKYFCLDLLGVALRGSTTPSAQAVTGALARVGRFGPSVVWGTSHRALPEYAALANGIAAHSIELDDVSNAASLHPGVVVFPAALACGDLVAVDGKTFITAVAAGYDVIVRLGRALKPEEHYARGFHPTGTCGAFGAAALSGRLLGLKEEALLQALGIAGSQAAGSMEFLAQGTWTKRMHAGWAAHSGLWAALLAREGFTGPTTIIEGRSGFLQAYSGDPNPDLVLEELGEVFHITRTSVKPHACCRYNQGPIDCILQIVRQHHVEARGVEKVTVGVLGAGFNIVAAPEEQKRNPTSVTDMQFSMPFGAAVALLYGRAFLSEYTEEVARRPEVRELMNRVQCVQDPALDSRFPRLWPAWAEIQITDGHTLRAEIEYPKGDPENALSWGELKEKFSDLSTPVLSEERQRKIITTVEALEALKDIRELTGLLAGG